MSALHWKQVVIPREKLEDYLLSSTHLVGRAKAKFFQAFGFDESGSSLLENELHKIAHSGKITDRLITAYGTKIVIEGILDSPSGKQVTMKTVWMLDIREEVLRFVTAYPVR